MKIRCDYGFYTFEEYAQGDISRFASYFGLDIVRDGEKYTFEGLAGAENYSILGKTYLNLPAIETYAGEPWEILRENRFVYSVALGILVPLDSVAAIVSFNQAGNYYVTNGLIQAGAVTKALKKIVSFQAWFDFKTFSFRYTDFVYDE